jgi:hypothetical protein
MQESHSISLIAVMMLLTTAVGQAHTPPASAKVYFIGLLDGAVVKSPFKVKFGIKNFGITPAGTTGKRRHIAGHHHLLIDVQQLPDMDEVIPRDENHIHFDKGETETLVELPAGKHTLQLLLADEQHEPHDPPLISDKITIIVE